MAREKILVVEDEEDIAELIEYNLLKNGYAVQVVSSGEEAIPSARKQGPDLVLLDLMLPGIDGLEVCRRLKGDVSTRDIPVIMVTARGDEGDVVAGLELGADDYILKPFSPRVLAARVGAVLRRKPAADGTDAETVRAGGMEILPGRREVFVQGESVSLTFTEFNILLTLAKRPGWVFTRIQISEAVRGGRYHVTERSVDVHIRALRKKLETGADSLETVRGVGYRFRE
jgi:two-component system alkaline phosphatase synthesis response regulator PhoP